MQNIQAVAKRLEAMLKDKRYTFVSTTDAHGPDRPPDVRTGQRLTPENTVDGKAVSFHDHGSYGSVTINDSYGLMSFSAIPKEQERQRYDIPWLSFGRREGCGQFTITHRAPAGHLLHWVIAVEESGDEGGDAT